ncbi:glycosyltransferase family 4 protein [Massilia sp. TSP1-1-2]|uniref:glycosyltransferase family 4 protein n=1 Tax=Massilia sp. TSP1-1-2 TaxID=2804649 RepID=UPI003CF4EB32
MKPEILITLDSMRHANTGLYTFGNSLGREILRQVGSEFGVHIYAHPDQRAVLGEAAGYVRHRHFHRLFFPSGGRFDVVHFADQYCRFGPSRVRAKTIMTVHDMNQIYEQQSGTPKLARYMRRMAAKIAGADRVVTISQYVAADLVRHFPAVRDKLSVIYNGADASWAPPGHQPVCDPGAPFLFTLGMLCAKKNFHVLVPLLHGNERKLVIAGIVKEEYKQKILAEAAAHGVSERVIITGPVSQHDKDWYYAHCEAFVFPSLAEGFGLPVLEAMHHGKPVFLSTHTTLPEIGGAAAYYFDNFDPDNMRRVLEHGLLDFAASGGADRVRAHASQFTWEKAAAAYLALYRTLASGA